MPSSDYQQIPRIVGYISELRPESVLDIGFGFGKFGFLAREYLEIWGELRYYPSQWKTKIDGIEVYQRYICDWHKIIYDDIFVGEAMTIMKDFKDKKYKLAMAIDVLEHFEKKQGISFIKECQRIAENTLIGTPLSFFEQGTVLGNEYETHKSLWTEKELEDIGAKRIIDNTFSLIAVF